MITNIYNTDKNEQEDTMIYKSVDKNVIALKVVPNTQNNFNRPSVANKNYAKYRCETAIPNRIYNKFTKEYLTEYTSVTDKITYKINVPLTIPMSRPLDVVTGTGIHCYLSEERALYDNNDVVNNRQKQWSNDGLLITDNIYVNGNKGKFVKLDINGTQQNGIHLDGKCSECNGEYSEKYTIDGLKISSSVKHQSLCSKMSKNLFRFVFAYTGLKDLSYIMDNITYLNGVKHGDCMQEIRYANHYKTFRVQYTCVNDVLHGLVTEEVYNTWNNIITEENQKGKILYNYMNGQIHGPVKGTYNYNTSINETEHIIGEFRHGVGYARSYYDADHTQLKFITNYINSMRSGEHCRFTKNNIIEYRYNYVNDDITGEYTTYYDDGRTCDLYTYKNNKMNGEYRKYTQDGLLQIVSNYVDDTLNGKYIAYTPSEKIIEEGNYVNGKREGLWKVYGNNDDPTSNYYRKVSFIVHYPISMLIEADINFQNDEWNGWATIRTRTENGQKTHREYFKNGKCQKLKTFFGYLI